MSHDMSRLGPLAWQGTLASRHWVLPSRGARDFHWNPLKSVGLVPSNQIQKARSFQGSCSNAYVHLRLYNQLTAVLYNWNLYNASIKISCDIKLIRACWNVRKDGLREWALFFQTLEIILQEDSAVSPRKTAAYKPPSLLGNKTYPFILWSVCDCDVLSSCVQNSSKA